MFQKEKLFVNLTYLSGGNTERFGTCVEMREQGKFEFCCGFRYWNFLKPKVVEFLLNVDSICAIKS